MYKFLIRVSNFRNNTAFVMFDSEAKKFLGCLASQLVRKHHYKFGEVS